jgi:hypothetical protein
MRYLLIDSLLLLLAVSTTYGQQLNASISGAVRDTNGAAITGASVTVIERDKKTVVWKTTTDDAGMYRAPSVPVGIYNLTFEASGFKKVEINDVVLQVDQRARVNATLTAGDMAERVVVEGGGIGLLQSESSSLGDTINTSHVKNLPLPNRNILNLLTLAGGVSSGGAATGINSAQLSINGSRTVNNEITVDGVSVVSGSTGGPQRLPSAEAIREFRVLTSSYSSEYGRTSGGTVNVVVESGDNQLRGGLYYYFRNEALNANDFFRNARGERRQQDRWNQYGGKLGGPIVVPKVYNGRDRSFFFVNYEGLLQRSPSSQISTIPDERFRAGDFSGSGVIVNDPLTGMPFPGNRIPSNRVDPAAARIMSLLPAPNTVGNLDAATGRRVNNFVQNQPTSPNRGELTLRLDHNAGEKRRLFGRFTRFSSEDPIASILPGPLEAAVGDGITRGYQTAIGMTNVWSPTLLTEVNVGFQRNDPKIDPPSLGLDVRDALGIQRSVGNATPRFNISGFRELGTNENTWRVQIDNNYHLAAALTWVKASHVVKFGWQLRKNQFNVFNPGGLWMGRYSFNGEITSSNRSAGNPVHALADFLLGQIQTVEYELFQPITGRRNSNTAFYVQDDWKVTPRLTFNLGLRYDYESPMTIANNMYSRVNPQTGKLLVAKKNASRTLDLEGDKLNLGPRVGFAWSLNDKTVIRSGFGVFFSQIFSNLGGIVRYPGFTVAQNFPDLGAGVAQPFRLFEGHPLTAVQSLDDPFFVERQATTSNPLSPSAQFGEVDPLPSALTWNLGVQREILRGTIVEVSYVGARGVHLPLNLPFNQVPFGLGTEVARQGSDVATQMARPFPTVSGFSSFVHAGSSTYHALQIKGTRQTRGNLSFHTIYTWSKSLDDGSGLFSFSQPNGLDTGQFLSLFRHLDRAPSAFDRTHNFAFTATYATTGPVWLRDFQISPIIIVRTGLPDTITQNNLHPTVSQQRPDVINSNHGGYAPNRTSEGAAIRWLLPTSATDFPFAPTGPLFTGSGNNRRLVLPFDGIGTLGRNTTRNPREVNFDLAVARRFRVGEHVTLTIRGEAFNLLNHVNLNGPNTSLTVIANSAGQPVWNSPNFGLITSAKSARFMQIVARIDF